MASSSRQNLPAEYTDEWGVTWVKLDNCDGYVQEANLPYQKKKERAFQRQREYQMQQQHQQQQASAAASTGSDITREWWKSHWTKPAAVPSAGSSSADAAPPAAVPSLAPLPEGVTLVDIEPAPALCSKPRATAERLLHVGSLLFFFGVVLVFAFAFSLIVYRFTRSSQWDDRAGEARLCDRVSINCLTQSSSSFSLLVTFGSYLKTLVMRTLSLAVSLAFV
jgi:hypothetical protein